MIAKRWKLVVLISAVILLFGSGYLLSVSIPRGGEQACQGSNPEPAKKQPKTISQPSVNQPVPPPRDPGQNATPPSNSVGHIEPVTEDFPPKEKSQDVDKIEATPEETKKDQETASLQELKNPLPKPPEPVAKPEPKFKLAEIPNLIGLNNLGNTCFLNSMIQVLYHCRPFRKGLAKVVNDPNVFARNPQAKALFDLFKAMDSSTKSLGSSDIKVSALVEPKFDDKRPHRLYDVYYHWQNMNYNMWKPLELTRRIIKILYMKDGTEERTDTIDRYPVIATTILMGEPDTKSILSRAFRKDDLGLCEKLRKTVDKATIHYTVESAPEAFVIAINRLNAAGTQKDYTALQVDRVLYLDEYMNEYDPTVPKKHVYRLRSFAYNINMFHFISFACDDDDNWYEFNDSYVSGKRSFSSIKKYADAADLYVYEHI